MDEKTKEAKKLNYERPLRRISTLVPKTIREYYEKRIRYAGIKEDVSVWLGKSILLSLWISLFPVLGYLGYNIYSGKTYPDLSEDGLIIAGVFFGTFILLNIITFFRTYFKISDRSNNVEKVLPDFLLLSASNLRAGMATFPAFLAAARPEFGEFSQVVLKASAKANSSQSLVDAFMEIKIHFKSQILDRTVNLIAKGMRSGAHLSRLLSSSAEEIRHIEDLRAELATATKTYTVFLGFIIIVIMPFLLSVSNQFIAVFLAINSQQIDTGGAGIENLPTFSGKISITTAEMFNISIFMLVETCMLVSALMGLISRGNALYGLKYFPFMAIAAIIVFFITKSIIASMFTSFAIS